MDDLTTMLSQVLSDPQSMQQIQAMAASLGLTGEGSGLPALPPPAQTAPQAISPPAQESTASGGGLDLSALQGLDLSALAGLLGGAQNTPAPPVPAQPAAATGGLDLSALAGLLGGLQNQPAVPQPAANTGGPDLSALAGLLGGLQGAAKPAAAQPAAGGFDLSALSGLLGGITGGQQAPAQTSGKADLSALTALLGGNPHGSGSGGGGGLPFDMGTLLKLQQAMSSMTSNRANVDLLMALKPRLKEERAKKVDDAVRVMQLIQFLPLIKETGLFGDMDNILGSLGGKSGSGGLGGIVSGLGDGIGGVLGNLFGGRKQA